MNWTGSFPISTVHVVVGALIHPPELPDGLQLVLLHYLINFSQTWFFASITAPAATRPACRYMSTASEVQMSHPGSLGLFLQLKKKPLTSGIHCQVWGSQLQQAPEILWPKLWKAASASGEESPFGLIVSSLPQDPVKALPEVGVEDLPTRGIHEVFLTPNTFGFLPSQQIKHTTDSAPF